MRKQHGHRRHFRFWEMRLRIRFQLAQWDRGGALCYRKMGLSFVKSERVVCILDAQRQLPSNICQSFAKDVNILHLHCFLWPACRCHIDTAFLATAIRRKGRALAKSAAALRAPEQATSVTASP